MENQKIYENILVKRELSDLEKVEGSKLLAELVVKCNDLEIEKAAASSDFGSQIKSAKAEITKLAQTIKDGYELEDVRAEKVLDFIVGQVHYLDPDTFEIVKARPMTADEKQMKLPGTELPLSE